MKLPRRPTLPAVVVVVSHALGRAGLRAVLTGGACATIHSRGAYLSHDLDFVIQGAGSRATLDDAMASVGFRRQGDRYVHPGTTFFVEFVGGPLAIGQDLAIRPVRIALPGGSALGLSATDACRDRLAAFFHWADRQSLAVAVEIAIRSRVRMATIRRWSVGEGALAKFEEFAERLEQRRKASRARTPGTPRTGRG